MDIKKIGQSLVDVALDLGTMAAENLEDSDMADNLKSQIKDARHQYHSSYQEKPKERVFTDYSDEELEKRIKYLLEEMRQIDRRENMLIEKPRKMGFFESMKYAGSQEYYQDERLKKELRAAYDKLDNEFNQLRDIQIARIESDYNEG